MPAAARSQARAHRPARPTGGQADISMCRATRNPAATAYGYVWRSGQPTRNRKRSAIHAAYAATPPSANPANANRSRALPRTAWAQLAATI